MEKLEEEVKLFEDMVKFMEKIYITNEQVMMGDRKVLSVARDNVNDVQRELCHVISSSSAMDVSLIVKDYRSRVEKELNDICNKVSNLNIKADIRNYVKPDTVIKDAAAAAPYIAYLEKRKKLILEYDDYKQTLEFINKLKVTAKKEQVSKKDLSILLRGYSMIMRVYRPLSKTIMYGHSSSVWDIDVSLTINESRTKVENELNYMCNNMTDHAIKEDISQHLAGFKAGHLPKKLLPLHDDAVIDDDDNAAAYIAYLEKRNKLNLEYEDYKQTLEFINKLKVIAKKKQVSGKDLSILLRGYSMIMRVYRALFEIIMSGHSSSVWDIDVSLTINEFRTKVENELNCMCSNMIDHAIKEDISQHLAGFKAGHRPKKLLPLIFADRRKRVSSQSEMKTTKNKSKLGSGDGEFRRDADYAFGYPNHRKRIKKQAESNRKRKQAESCYSQITAIFGDWNFPEHVGKEIETQHAYTVDDLMAHQRLMWYLDLQWVRTSMLLQVWVKL